MIIGAGRNCRRLCAALWLAMLPWAQPAGAEPGFGAPLSLTTGTVYAVNTLAELKDAVIAANAAGQPATILLADQTYVLDIPTLHITCPGLIIRSAGGDRNRVVIRGPDEGPNASVHNVFLVGANDVTIADMTLGYCRYHGVQIQGESPHDVSGTRIHNCRILNCNEQFIKGSSSEADPVGATDGIIESCWFEFTSGWAYQYYTGGIDIHKGVNWTVRDNRFLGIRNPSALPNICEHAIHFWKRCPTRPQRIVVERNWIINCDRGIGFGLGGFDSGHQGGGSVVRNNLVYNDGAGAHTDVGIGLESADQVSVDNNTVYIPAYWAPIEYRFAASSNLVFRNNLVNSPIRNRDAAPPAAVTANVENAQAAWFADIATGDLRLHPSAIGAIDQGVTPDSFSDDVDGQPRPVFQGWDVGADEWRPGWAALPPGRPAPFDEGIEPLGEIHVAPAPTGNDASGNGTAGHPYATLGRAAQNAVPGSAVVLASGTYPGGTFLYDLQGSATAPIWIRGADPANRPVLSGGGEGLHLVRARYVVVENLEIAGSTSNGLNCDDGGEYADPDAARFLVFRNLFIHDIGSSGNQDGLKLSGLDDYWVLDSAFARCGGNDAGSGIDQVGCHRGWIARCRFDDLSGNAIQCKGGSAEIDIRQCHIVNPGQRGVNLGGSTGPSFFRPPLSTTGDNVEARAIRVIGNLFQGGITPVAFVGCSDSLVANNTIVDPEAWHFRILQENVSTPPYAFAPCADSAFVNNLVFFDHARLRTTDINVGANTDPTSFTLANNLWYAHDNPAASSPDYPVPESHGRIGEDPRLANPGSGDYTFTLQSPGARAGLILPGLDRDLSGRRYLSPPSIGALELVGDLDHDGLGDRWELQYFGATNVSDGTTTDDADQDAFRDSWEYVAGTDPTDPTSALRMAGIEPAHADHVILRWPSVAGRTYCVQRASSPTPPTGFVELACDVPANPPTNQFTDPGPTAAPSAVYFVRASWVNLNADKATP